MSSQAGGSHSKRYEPIDGLDPSLDRRLLWRAVQPEMLRTLMVRVHSVHAIRCIVPRTAVSDHSGQG